MSMRVMMRYLDRLVKSLYEKPSAREPITGPMLLIEAAERAKACVKSLPAMVRPITPKRKITKKRKKKPKTRLTEPSRSALLLYRTGIMARGWNTLFMATGIYFKSMTARMILRPVEEEAEQPPMNMSNTSPAETKIPRLWVFRSKPVLLKVEIT